MNRAVAAIEQALGALCAALLAGLVVVIAANVVGRLLGAALAWSQEAAQWLFIALIFLGLPVAARHGQSLAILILDRWLDDRGRALRTLIAEAIGAFVLVKLLLGGRELMMLAGGISTALGLPNAWLYATIPFGAGLTLALRAMRGRVPAVAAIAIGAAATMLALPGGGAGWMIVAFVAALALGVPVWLAMLFAVFAGADAILPGGAVAQNMVRGAGQFLLIAVPLFLVAAGLMNAGGLSARLIDFAAALVGRRRGGLAQVTVVGSALYAGVSGSSNADAALNAKLLVPQMIQRGYPPAYAAAIAAASAALDNVIPPSIAMLILASAINVSIGALFLAGVLPGLVMAAALMIAVAASAPAVVTDDPPPLRRSALRAIPVLLIGVFVVGGLRAGLVTPTESGVLAVLATVALSGRQIARAWWLELKRIAAEAALVGILIGAAMPMSFVIAAEGLAQALAAWVTTLPAWSGILAINLILLLAGMVLDIGAALLILGPLLLPVAVGLGMDPIHYGAMVVVNLMIGGLTPPHGILAFIVAGVSGIPVERIFRALVPFIAALLVALALISFVPAIALGPAWVLG